MTVLKSFFIAFAVYSKIPVPQFPWKKEDMRYMLCFFPWIGAVIGVLVYGWGIFCESFPVGSLCHALIGAAVPLLLTGGFHVDGFMDTMDAFHSYQPRERKLEILKDSHIGAFSVIMLAALGLVYMGAFSEVADRKVLSVAAAGFFLSRVLSGISVLVFPKAKKEGMVQLFAGSARKGTVLGALVFQGILCAAFMLWRSVTCGTAVLLTALAVFGYYRYRTGKEFGGVTGDTSGYFVVLCECAMMMAAAVCNMLISG
ncbi:MAG: adenosylcobinamide-GDP ribazoletransferase [Lachnospiraceae bacterium]|nr:adenosylcobinamide-GDP ribazoletransferase [Lachnospiraceae bacterium]